MNTLYANYVMVKDQCAHGLSIRLEELSQQPMSTWLGHFKVVWQQWHQAKKSIPQLRFRVDLTDVALPECQEQKLQSYVYSNGQFNDRRFARHLDMVLEDGNIHHFGIKPGQPCDGRDLVGREESIDNIVQQLKTNSVHLRAPRRYGKTGLLRRLNTDLQKQNQSVLFLDVSPAGHVSQFFILLAEEAMKNNVLRNSFVSSQSLLTELAGWPEPDDSPQLKAQARQQLKSKLSSSETVMNFGRRLLNSFAESHVWLLMDEFNVFLRKMLDAKVSQEELAAFCRLLQEHRLNSRQIIAGSTGLTSLIRFNKLESYFSPLQPIDLRPLPENYAQELAEELFYGINLIPSPLLIEQLLNCVGRPTVPYFIHVLVDKIRLISRSQILPLPENIQRCYEDHVLGQGGIDTFREYELSQQPYPKELQKAAQAMLQTIASKGEQGVSESELKNIFEAKTDRHIDFECLLACLEEDYDLIQQDNQWSMRCKVLRDRWNLQEPWLTQVT